VALTFAALGLFCLSSAAALGQAQGSQTEDLQQLKERLHQVEQEMQGLEGQISFVEAKASAAPTATSAASTEPSTETAPPSPKKSTIDLYGFVMVDSGYEFGQTNPNWFDVMRPTQLASFKGEFAPDGNVYFSVRQTQFGVKTSTPTQFGDLKTQFEFELFGTGADAGQTIFRLRHAYGELGQFGAGQYWSPFMDIDVFPNSVEYWGPSGMVFFRNLQLRWMPIRNDRAELVLALERPGASADPGTLAGRIELQGIKPKFDMPDFSGHVRFMRKWGYVQVAGMLRKISWVDTNPNPTFHLGDDVFGWGVNISSNLKFGKKDVGRFQVIYGEGVENYMNDAPVDIGVKNNPSSALRPVLGVPLPVLGVVSFLDHTWSERFSTSLGYSLVNIENSNAQNPSDYHQGHYALINLLYRPVPQVMVGSEFIFGRRVNFLDGFNVNDYRLQFSFKYNWKKGFEF
jgi:hypothetical protein